MDELVRDQFFSRQAKATKHLFNSFKAGKHRSLDFRNESFTEHIDPVKLLEKLLKDKSGERGKEKTNSPSSFFRSVGRDFALNPNEIPGVGQYTPVYTALDSRINQAPKYSKPHRNKKTAKIFLPGCIDEHLNCSHQKSKIFGNVDPITSRTVQNLKDFEERRKRVSSLTPIPEKPQNKIPMIRFATQKARDPFVKSESGPNEKRFEYMPSKFEISLRFKRPESVDFSKNSFRKASPPTASPGPYDTNSEFILQRLVKNIDFSKQLERKPLVLEHILKSPNSPDLTRYNTAYEMQGNIKGITKLPLMKTLTPRDDSMYKVTEAYSLNSKRSHSPSY